MSRQRRGQFLGDLAASVFFMAVFAMVGLICIPPTTPPDDTNRSALDLPMRR
jgi:hypothetical protein